MCIRDRDVASEVPDCKTLPDLAIVILGPTNALYSAQAFKNAKAIINIILFFISPLIRVLVYFLLKQNK